MPQRNVHHEHTVMKTLRDKRFTSMQQILDGPPPWLFRKLIPVLSANLRIRPEAVERIRSAAKAGPVVYAMKFRSVYDLHLLRMRCEELGLPLPGCVFGFPPWGMGSVFKVVRDWATGLSQLTPGVATTGASAETMLKEVLENGGAGVIVLADENTFRARYLDPEKDPLQVVLNVQGALAATLSVVPLTILYDRGPRRIVPPFWETLLGNPERPGPLARILIALRKWSRPELIVGKSIAVVGQFEEFGGEVSWEELPFELRRSLLESINAPIRVIRGPEKLSRTEIKELVLQDSRVQQAIRRIKLKENRPEWQIRKKAEAYVDEIAADQQIHVIHFFYHLLKWIFSHAFDGIDTQESQFKELRDAGERGSLIIVPCHKSHFDYLIVLFLLFVNRMAVPLTAAGKNLSFWPVGPALRRAAAFFIRRSFKGIPLYTRVFSAYCKVLVREKYNIAFFIEGGRSRTGKLLHPRLGMLTFLLQTVEEGSVKDLNFVPLFIGYEQIPEEGSYLKELTGKQKKAESVSQMLRARKFLQRRHGKVHIRVHPPVSYRSFCQKWAEGVDPTNLAPQQRRQLINDFAYYIESGILRVGVITAVDLASAALLCARKYRVSHSQVMDAVLSFLDAFRFGHVELADSLTDVEEAVQAALAIFRKRGFIEIETDPDGSFDGAVYRIGESEIQHLRFYRNSVVNYLWPHAFLAAILLSGHSVSGGITPEIEEQFTNLKTLFRSELIYDPLKEDSHWLEEAFRFFSHQSWIAPSHGGEPAIESTSKLTYFREIMTDFFQLYFLSLVASESVDEPVSQKEFSKLIDRLAQEYGPSGEPLSSGSFLSVAVQDALTRLNELGIVEFMRSKKTIKRGQNEEDRHNFKELLRVVLGRSE